jgi:hypothetical protein
MLAGNIPGQTKTIPMAIYFAVEAGDMRQAVIWVLIVLSLALSAIAAVNYWTDLQKKFPNQIPIIAIPSHPRNWFRLVLGTGKMPLPQIM